MVKKQRNSWQRNLFILCLVIVPLLHFCIFYIYVNFNSILMSFQVVENGKEVFSLRNFEMLFDEISRPTSVFWQSVKNTGIFFVQGFITGIITGFVICYFLYTGIPGSKIFRVLLFLPSLLSSVVIAKLFSMVVGAEGPVAWIVQKLLGLSDTPLLLGDSTYALKTLLGYNIWFGLAGNMVLYMGALNRIPKDVLEYAKIDGVGWVRELTQIILPLLWPTVITLITIQFTGIFGASGPIFLFTQGKYHTYTISYWLFEKVYNMPVNSPSLNYGAAIGLFFTAIALPIVFSVRWGLGKLQEAVEY